MKLESTGFGGGRIIASDTPYGTEYTPNYHITDHLGSVRVVFTDSHNVLARNDYYAFGKRHFNANQQTADERANRWVYNGKEMQNFSNLGFLDYGARMFDSEIGRWFVIDPLAEKYHPYGPCVYVGNNPIRRIDLDGRDWRDKVWGGIIGVATNILPASTFLREGYNPNNAADYNNTLQQVDETAQKVGVVMAAVGAAGTGAGLGIVGTGATVTAVSGGSLAIAGIPAIAVGAEVALAGAVSGLGGTLLMANSAANKEKGYNYGSEESSKSPKGDNKNQYKRIGDDKMKELKQNGFEPHGNKPKQGGKGGKIDYYKDSDGNIYYRTKKGDHYEPTNYNINDF